MESRSSNQSEHRLSEFYCTVKAAVAVCDTDPDVAVMVML
jgi:hypothetical protein